VKTQIGKTCAILLGALAIANLVGLPVLARAQSRLDTGDSLNAAASIIPAQPDLAYTPPTETKMFHNYLSDAFGPFTMFGVALAAGYDQATNTPSEWKRGTEGYGRRLASEFGISTVSRTTNYALAAALKEDPSYYPCECKGVLPRLGHAVISSFTARRGEDGHRVFSFPALVAPYAGTLAAVYGWYPRRYDARDALRLGNYYLLVTVSGNIAKEFLSGGPHSWLSRLHLSKVHGAPNSD
jgi:hypothetical protein